MKILRVTSNIYPNVVGGTEIHSHEMSNSQVNLGHDVTVITLINNEEKSDPNTKYKVIKIKKLFTLFGNSISLSFLINLSRILSNYDIIHAHSHLHFTTNVCATLRKLNTFPLIITNHGLYSQTVPAWIQRLFIPTIAKWSFESV